MCLTANQNVAGLIPVLPQFYMRIMSGTVSLILVRTIE